MFDLKEAAEMLGVTPRTVRRYIKQGKIQGEKKQTQYGPKWFIPASEIDTQEAVMEVVPLRRPVSKEEFQEALGEVLEVKLNQQKQALREEINEEVTQTIAQFQERINDLEKQLEARDRELMEAIREKQQEEDDPPSFWQRLRSWFGG